MKGYHVAVVAVVCALAGVYCLRAPEVPEWDVEANIPLYSGCLRLVDFLDTTFFRIGADSTVAFSLALPLDTARPDEALEVLALDSTNRVELEHFVICKAGAGQVKLTLAEMTGLPLPDSGSKSRVPPFENQFSRDCRIDGLERAEVLEAVFRVTVANYSSVDFDSLAMVSPLGRLGFGPVPGGARLEARMRCAGVCLNSPFVATFIAGSSGSDTVTLSRRDSVVFGYALESLRVGSARMRIPDCEGQRRCHVTIAPSKPFRVDSLELTEGTWSLELANDFAVPARVRLSVPALRFTGEYQLDRRGKVSVSLPLGGLRIDNRNRVNSLFDYVIWARPEATDELVELRKNDGVTVAYQTTTLRTTFVAGEFKSPVYIGSCRRVLPEVVPYRLRGVRVANAELALDITNSVGFPLAICLRLFAFRQGERAATLEQTLTAAAGQLEQPSVSEFVFPVTELLNVGPDSLGVEYSCRIIGSGSCQQGAFSSARAVVSTPLRLAFVPDTVETPTRTVELQEKQRKLVAKHLSGASVRIDARSQLPVGLTGRLVLVRDSVSQGMALTDSLVVPFGVTKGKLDRHGYCVGSRDTTVVAELDSAALSLLQVWPLAARLCFELPASDTVTVLSTDRLGLTALLMLRIRTGGDR